MALEQFRAPALLTPPGQYEQRYMQQLANALRLYFTQLDSETPNKAYSYRTNGVIFNSGGLPDLLEGQLGWNSTEGTLNLGMEYGVIQQIGQEYYARVQNDTGVEIPNGSLVGFAGVGPDYTLSVAPYLADGSQPSLYVLGVMTHDLPDTGNKGLCTVWGHVRDLDTSAFSQGDILYASPSTAGGFTNIKPTAPNNCIPVAAVLRAHATEGEIFVRPTIEQQKYYGTFAKTASQTPAATNTAYPLTFTTTQVSNGVTIGTPASRIVVVQSGLYQFDATIQLSSGNSSAKNVWFWFRRNGTDVANSARIITSDTNNGYAPISLSQTISLAASDYVEIVFAASNTAVSVSAVAATAFAPGAPAVLLSVTQVQL
jgi:hypothetical protein